MVIAAIEYLMDTNYEKNFGRQNDFVFEKCIGCRCTRLLSEKSPSTRSLLFSCGDNVDENRDSILTHVYLIWPEVVEGYTEYTVRFCIESAEREGCSLRKEIEQLGIEFNISVRMKSWQSIFLTVVRCLRIINLPHTS